MCVCVWGGGGRLARELICVVVHVMEKFRASTIVLYIPGSITRLVRCGESKKISTDLQCN